MRTGPSGMGEKLGPAGQDVGAAGAKATISPYVPMTYVVHSLRIAMRGTDLGLIGPDVATLVLFAGVSFLITCLAARRRRLITMNDLHPLVDLWECRHLGEVMGYGPVRRGHAS